MIARLAAAALTAAAAWWGCGTAGPEGAYQLMETELTIPQVDYEPAIYHKPGDPLPYIDLQRVGWDRRVDKVHRAVILETEYLQVTVLPEMGRVYSMVYRPTGHETLWRNDVVRPGGGNNATGWWLWIGGIEYTLPGDEHGTTWALPWQYEVLENSLKRQALRMSVREPTTGLVENIDLSVYPGSASLEAEIAIHNPTADTVRLAHWVNPMWAPGGRNELTDNTEFIIPAERVLIEQRWQKNLGPSPQAWHDSPLRHLRNWGAMGDLMADGLTAGFYSAYSHDAEEGVVRVFDPLTNPGVDVWTYGFHPEGIPMGSGAPNKGYAEMWGGTVKTFPHEQSPLAPGATLRWRESIFPYQKTRGLVLATETVAANGWLSPSGRELWVALCPSRRLVDATLEVRLAGRAEVRRAVEATPHAPLQITLDLAAPAPAEGVLVLLWERDSEVARWRADRHSAESRPRKR